VKRHSQLQRLASFIAEKEVDYLYDNVEMNILNDMNKLIDSLEIIQLEGIVVLIQ